MRELILSVALAIAANIHPYVFTTQKGEKIDAELGTFFVPENRSDPQSHKIELAFVRFKSTSKHPGTF